MKRSNIAVILAGGTGQRFQTELPKQFVKLGEKTVIEHTVSAFEAHDAIDEIAVVAHPDYLELLRQIVRQNPWKKVRKLLTGGTERYLSSLAAIRAYEGESVNLILHDAARPLIDGAVIAEVAAALEQHAAVGVAIPATDTVWQIDPETMTIRNVPDRSAMFLAQTPQAFHLETIREAYAKGLEDPEFFATDDCGVVKKYLPEIPLHVVCGSRNNIKLTHLEDLRLAESQLLHITEK